MVAVLVGLVVLLTCRVLITMVEVVTVALAALEKLLQMELPTLAAVVAAGEMAHSVVSLIVVVDETVEVVEVLLKVAMPRLTAVVEVAVVQINQTMGTVRFRAGVVAQA